MAPEVLAGSRGPADGVEPGLDAQGRLRPAARAVDDEELRVVHSTRIGHGTSLFSELVLGCIDRYDSEKWRIFFTFFEIYTICTLSHRSERKFSTNFADFFVKLQQNLQNFGKFKIDKNDEFS